MIDDLQQMENDEVPMDGSDLYSANGEVCVAFVESFKTVQKQTMQPSTQMQAPALRIGSFMT